MISILFFLDFCLLGFSNLMWVYWLNACKMWIQLFLFKMMMFVCVIKWKKMGRLDHISKLNASMFRSRMIIIWIYNLAPQGIFYWFWVWSQWQWPNYYNTMLIYSRNIWYKNPCPCLCSSIFSFMFNQMLVLFICF